jgi:hypothetical protein
VGIRKEHSEDHEKHGWSSVHAGDPLQYICKASSPDFAGSADMLEESDHMHTFVFGRAHKQLTGRFLFLEKQHWRLFHAVDPL